MLAEAFGRALARIGHKLPPPLVVFLDELAPARIVEAAVVDGCVKRQARAQRRRRGRPAHRKPCHREDMRRQPEKLAGLGNRVAQGA